MMTTTTRKTRAHHITGERAPLFRKADLIRIPHDTHDLWRLPDDRVVVQKDAAGEWGLYDGLQWVDAGGNVWGELDAERLATQDPKYGLRPHDVPAPHKVHTRVTGRNLIAWL